MYMPYVVVIPSQICSFGHSRFSERNPTIFGVHFEIWLTAGHVSKIGWDQLGDLRLNCPIRAMTKMRKCMKASK